MSEGKMEYRLGESTLDGPYVLAEDSFPQVAVGVVVVLIVLLLCSLAHDIMKK